MSKIATHPDRKLPEFKASVARVTKEVQADLAKLEQLKPEINKRFVRYEEGLARIRANREKEQRSKREDGVFAQEFQLEDTTSFDDDGQGNSRLLNAGEHSELALKLGHRELRRRRNARPHDDDDLSRRIEALGRQLHEQHRDTPSAKARPDAYAYPHVPNHIEKQTHLTTTAPLVPAKEKYPSTSSPHGLPFNISRREAPPIPSKVSQQTTPTSPRTSTDDATSSDYTFKPLAFSEAGTPLRPVFLPKELRLRFLAVARPNTSKNLETCGILCGSLISGALFISHLVIPDQNSTSDTCDTTEEGDNALFDYVDGEQLMVCGWIHTHPTQTCFLSSRDLHTSVGYQVMLPESISIVCAPTRDPDHGIFRLTDPPGKQAILGCHLPGLFHPHEQTNLYTDASRPGHVNELDGLQFELVDLRKKG